MALQGEKTGKRQALLRLHGVTAVSGDQGVP
jgi:hypothetical protein